MTVTAQLNVEAECANVPEQDVHNNSVRPGQGLRTGRVKEMKSNRNGHTKRQRRAVALMNDMGILNLFCY